MSSLDERMDAGVAAGFPKPPTYAEHMRWCKDRALAYVEQGDLKNALASFASDIRKETCTDTPVNAMLVSSVGIPAVLSGNASEVRRFIEGFASA